MKSRCLKVAISDPAEASFSVPTVLRRPRQVLHFHPVNNFAMHHLSSRRCCVQLRYNLSPRHLVHCALHTRQLCRNPFIPITVDLFGCVLFRNFISRCRQPRSLTPLHRFVDEDAQSDQSDGSKRYTDADASSRTRGEPAIRCDCSYVRG